MLKFRETSVVDPIADELLGEYFGMREHGMTSYRTFRPDPATFTPPEGVFLVAELDGAPVGCGGMRMLSPARGEIKHLWVRPAARGTGSGRALLLELERRAAGFGATEVVLDTNERLEAAQSLYRSSGYVDVEPYNDNPNATQWFRKHLPPDAERVF
ncbi:GNAT family N-acetyltransferase [Pseudolysinimonas sp.]|uniref:GNAT family N-acetyltransferase n=1 Tax=Pseudolysinimonas sp. TaxID=2680009 RepID=UPI003784AB25